jgi:hypothetical protein
MPMRKRLISVRSVVQLYPGPWIVKCVPCLVLAALRGLLFGRCCGPMVSVVVSVAGYAPNRMRLARAVRMVTGSARW